MVQTALEAALEYIGRGWSIFPIHNKKPCIKWEQYQDSLPSIDLVRQWWTQYPDAGIALVLGKVSGVVRLDIDGAKAAEKLAEFCTPETLTFSTPSGGVGYLYKHRPGFQTTVLWKGDGKHEEIRFLADSRYTAVPPTPGYEWTGGEIAELPLAIVDKLLSMRAEKMLRTLELQVVNTVAEPDKSMIKEALAALHPARCDDRDSWLQIGMALHSAGQDYLETWIDWSRGSEKFQDGECERLWASFSDSGGITVRTLLYLAKQDGWTGRNIHEPLTDVGNGNALARACDGKFKFCRQWKDWLMWDGARWRRGSGPEVVEAQKRVIRERYNRAVTSMGKLRNVDDENAKRKLKAIAKVFRWCAVSEDAKHVHAGVDMASSMPGILIDHHQLDNQPWLFNCANGVLNLRTGELVPHDSSLLLTQCSPTAYSDKAVAPRWKEFLEEAIVDPDTIAWLKRFVGYCMTGIVKEHVLPVLYGKGRNGKSTFIKTICRVFGDDYAGTAPQHFLAVQRGEQHPTRIAELYGKRFMADIETEEGVRLDEAMVKRLTGGDELVARRMREDFWRFMPTHKLLLASNNQPEVRNNDPAIWSRLKLVPFNVSFAGREDFDLDAKLNIEAPGILRWAVEGCLEWQQHGLPESPQIARATEAYRSDQDRIADFIATCCVLEADVKVKTEELTRAYVAWCVSQNIRPMDGRPFGKALTDRGFQLDSSRKYRLCIRLATG